MSALKRLFAAGALAASLAGVAGCETRAQEGALIGGGLGAAGGALIGSAVTRHHGTGALVGGAIGAGAGAAIGAGIGAEQDRRERDRDYGRPYPYDPYYENRYGPPPAYPQPIYPPPPPPPIVYDRY